MLFLLINNNMNIFISMLPLNINQLFWYYLVHVYLCENAAATVYSKHMIHTEYWTVANYLWLDLCDTTAAWLYETDEKLNFWVKFEFVFILSRANTPSRITFTHWRFNQMERHYYHRQIDDDESPVCAQHQQWDTNR